MNEVVKNEVVRLLDVGMIYPISNSPWVCPSHVVPKKGGIKVVENAKHDLVHTRVVTKWRVCIIDYRRLNKSTWNDHFPLPFIDQMVERVSGHIFYYFLDGMNGCFQIPIALEDQEITTSTWPIWNFCISMYAI